MSAVYSNTPVVITVAPAGRAEVVTGYLIHFIKTLGAKPAEFVVLMADKRPKDVAAGSYNGQVCTLSIGGSVVCTGTIQRFEKRLSDQQVVFTVLDGRQAINSTYVGAGFLETLDTTPSDATYGIPTSFANGLPYYGADITFNLNGKPNRDKTQLAFVPPGFNHSTAYADYWTYGDIVEWLFTNCITMVSMPLPASTWQTITQANGDGGGASSFNVTYPVGVKWCARVTDTQTWLTSTATGTGTGSAQAVAYSLTANSTGASRTAYVHVSAWTFGGLERKADEIPLFGLPLGVALDRVFERTQAHWTMEGGNVVIFSVLQPSTSLALTIRNPDSPVSPALDDLTTPCELQVECATDSAVGQLDIIGGKEQREIMLTTTIGGIVYPGVQTASEFTKTEWKAIDVTPGWLQPAESGVFLNTWSNYQVQRYITIYLRDFPMLNPVERTYRHIINSDVWETHNIGKNIPGPGTGVPTYQPYKMLPQLLLGRAIDGSYVNPDEETALEGVSPMELLRAQFPDGATIDMDRGYILGKGVSVIQVNPYSTIIPPYYSQVSPLHFTVAMECAYRAYVSSVHNVAGLTTQIRRAIIRNEFIHKTRESTKVLMPVLVEFIGGGAQTFNVTDGIPLPPGATRDYAQSGSIMPGVDPNKMTITLPAGVVVDAMGELAEIKALVDSWVGIVHVNGNGAFPSWRTLAIGTLLTDASGTYDLTGYEIVTAVAWSHKDEKLEFMFTNRLGVDITALSENFVDSRAYRRPV